MNFLHRPMLVLLAAATVACAADGPSSKTGSTTESAAPAAGSVGSGQTLVLPGATVDQPPGWAFRQPSSSMRLAEAEIPGPGGPALLTVFFFGAGGGGGTDANLDRWAGQIEAAAGVAAERATFTVGQFTVSTIDVEGTLLPSRMGGGPTEPMPEARLLGGVVDGPGGPWFFKMTGPKDTVAAAASAFDDMLRSVRP